MVCNQTNEYYKKKRCDPAGVSPAWERAPRQNSAAAIEADRRLDDWVRSTAYRERNHRERQEFLKQLRQIVQQQVRQNLIYIDECGFDNRVYQDYGYALRGKKIYGSRTGKRTARENLIAARRNRELLAPMLIQGSVNAMGFEQWLEQWLCQELHPNSTLIMDNAPIHRKSRIEEIADAKGHQTLFLPRYSPDFNSIEHIDRCNEKEQEICS